MLNRKHVERGFTMIELMVSVAIGMILIAVIMNMYMLSIRGSGDSLKVSRLNQDLRSLLLVIDRDVRRAGYWAATPGTHDLSQDPFMALPNDLDVSELTGESAGSCITYSYDLDRDRMVGVGANATAAPFDAAPYDMDNMEQFGFRLSSSAVQMRTGLAALNETQFDCDSGAWDTITDNTIEITNLLFNVSPQFLNVSTDTACNPIDVNCCVSGEACQVIRDVWIEITGRLTNDTSVIKTVTALSRIRNDRYVVTP